MSNWPRRHQLALGLSVVALATVLWIVASARSYRTDGPLRSASEINVEFPLQPGQAATWGMTLPTNPTVADLRIESIAPAGAQGLDALGVLVNNPAIDGAIVNAMGFPPSGVHAIPPEDSVLPALGSASPERQVLIGVQLHDGANAGTIDGIRIRYEASGIAYETTLPWSLHVSSSGP